tara:strand:- start:3338 stop:4123 length:786 start_codon:yes stop_codon:yes gene_type:complete
MSSSNTQTLLEMMKEEENVEETCLMDGMNCQTVVDDTATGGESKGGESKDYRDEGPFNDAGARAKWSKWPQVTTQETASLRIPIDRFNLLCGGVFHAGATLCLDDDRKPNGEKKRNTVIKAVPDHQDWNTNCEIIYAIVCDGKIMKLGGTRTGMKERWGSYKCGHCVPERNKKDGSPYPGKMSVTNAFLYHTIEDGLLRGEDWKFYIWRLPIVHITVDILGTPTTIIAQTYHAYESKIMQKFSQIAGDIPLLCNNADPNYR